MTSSNATANSSSSSTPATHRYVAPGRLVRRVLNPMVGQLVRLGVATWGTSLLEVRGRTTGEWRQVPVNPLEVEGQRYLVAPRGHTQWVRNLRASGTGRIRRGRRVEPFTATEVADADKGPVLREYLDRFGWEVGKLVEGLTAQATDAELAAAASGFPVFRITPAAASGADRAYA